MLIYFEGQFSFEYEEKLTGMDVEVPGLAGAGRHELFDDTEFRCLDEVPAITGGSLRASPLVMFGGFCADGLGWHRALDHLGAVEAEGHGETEVDQEQCVDTNVKKIGAGIVSARWKDVPRP